MLGWSVMKEAPRSGVSTPERVGHVPPVAVYEGDVSSGQEQDSLFFEDPREPGGLGGT